MPTTTLCVDDLTLANWVNQHAAHVHPSSMIGFMANTFSFHPGNIIQNLISAHYTKTLTCLLEKNIIDVNKCEFFHLGEKNYYKLTPLMIAAKLNDLTMVEFFIEKGADLTTLDMFNTSNVLYFAYEHTAIFHRVLQLGKERNQLESLLLDGKDPEEVLTPHLYLKRSIDESENNIASFRLLLDYSVTLFTDYPEIASSVLNKITARYTYYGEDYEQVVKPLLEHPCFNSAYQYKKEFEDTQARFPADFSFNKAANTKITSLMLAFLQFLGDREQHQPYLALIESDLKKAVTAEQQSLCYDTLQQKRDYTRVYIDGILFPIPHAHYQKTSKSSLLIRVLQKRLRHYQYAADVERWIGYIPSRRANANLAKQVLFTESQYGSGLFHGKFSHGIQLCLLGEFMRNHRELTEYTNEEGKLAHFTLGEVVKLMTTETISKTKSTFWNKTIDSRTRQHYHLGDPFQLHSMLMFSDTLPLLAAYMRDSFCGGYLDLLKAFNQGGSYVFTPESFAEFMQKIELNSFIFTHYLYNAAQADYGVQDNEKKHASKSTHQLSFFAPNTPDDPAKSGYMITEKHYGDLDITLTELRKQHP